MTYISVTPRSPSGLARRLWRWLPAWPRRGASVPELNHLSERMLRDIGIQRDDLHHSKRNAAPRRSQ